MQRAVALLAVLSIVAPAVLASDSGAGRRLLLDNPQTQILSLINPNGSPAFCVNISRVPSPEEDKAHGAAGKAVAQDASALARKICSDPKAAAQDLYTQFAAGGISSASAGLAVKQAVCDDKLAASISELATVVISKAKSVADIEAFLRKQVQGLQDAGVPACITLLVADAAATKVESEKYFYTS